MASTLDQRLPDMTFLLWEVSIGLLKVFIIIQDL